MDNFYLYFGKNFKLRKIFEIFGKYFFEIFEYIQNSKKIEFMKFSFNFYEIFEKFQNFEKIWNFLKIVFEIFQKLKFRKIFEMYGKFFSKFLIFLIV